jgi:hypothetical protein
MFSLSSSARFNVASLRIADHGDTHQAKGASMLDETNLKITIRRVRYWSHWILEIVRVCKDAGDDLHWLQTIFMRIKSVKPNPLSKY